MPALRTYLRIFLVTGGAFGLLVGLLVLVVTRQPAPAAAVAGGAGLVFGGVMALVLGTVDAVSDRGRGRGDAVGPRQEATVPVTPGPDLPDRVVTTLTSLPASLTERDDAAGRFTARTRMTWKSFGEVVTVQLADDSGRTNARITSRPVVRPTIVDYGKGRSNVRAVADALRA